MANYPSRFYQLHTERGLGLTGDSLMLYTQGQLFPWQQLTATK